MNETRGKKEAIDPETSTQVRLRRWKWVRRILLLALTLLVLLTIQLYRRYHIPYHFVGPIGYCQSNPSSPNRDVGSLTIIGHRGVMQPAWSMAGLPLKQRIGNTRQSIKQAIEAATIDWIEIDVQVTKDGVLVLFHDQYLDQYQPSKTSGTGKVGDQDFDYIREQFLIAPEGRTGGN